MDDLTKKQRSYCMSRIRGKDTNVEIVFRKFLWKNGIRGYRVHNRNILGNPDLYFASKKLAVFIDGCFWHKCPFCFVRPKSNKKYWDEKIANNVKRDKRNNITLERKGVKVVRFWEHQIKSNIEGCFNVVFDILNKKN